MGHVACQVWFLELGHRHVQIHGAPAVANRGTIKLKVRRRHGIPMARAPPWQPQARASLLEAHETETELAPSPVKGRKRL